MRAEAEYDELRQEVGCLARSMLLSALVGRLIGLLWARYIWAAKNFNETGFIGFFILGNQRVFLGKRYRDTVDDKNFIIYIK